MAAWSPVASNTAVPVGSSDGSTQSLSVNCSRWAIETGAAWVAVTGCDAMVVEPSCS